MEESKSSLLDTEETRSMISESEPTARTYYSTALISSKHLLESDIEIQFMEPSLLQEHDDKINFQLALDHSKPECYDPRKHIRSIHYSGVVETIVPYEQIQELSYWAYQMHWRHLYLSGQDVARNRWLDALIEEGYQLFVASLP